MPAQGAPPELKVDWKDRLAAGGSVHGASRNAGSDPQAAHLSSDTAGEGGIVGSVHQAAIRNLLRDDVVEDAESGMNSRARTKLVGNRGAWLVDEQRRCRKEVVNVAQDDLIQRLIGFMRSIQEGAGRAAKEPLRTGDVGVPGYAHAVDEGRFQSRLVRVHHVVFEIADGHPFLQRDREVLLCGICGSISELRQVVVGDGRHSAFSEVVVAGIDTARIDTEVQRVPPSRPGQVVVDLPLRNLAPLRKRIVQATDSREGHAVAARGKHDGKGLERLRVIVRLEDARVPACAGVELIHEVRAEDVRVAHNQRALWLRRIGVKDGVDRIRPFRLQARILLKAVPDAVVGVDGVVDLHHDQVLAVAVVQRPLLLGCTAAAVEQRAICRSGQQVPGCVQRAGCDRHRRPSGRRQQREHVFVERNLCGLRRKVGSCDWIISARGKLPQHILLIGGCGQGRRCDDWQCDANALIVSKEEQLVPADRPAHADAKLIDHIAGFGGDVARCVVGVEEVIFRIEQRTVPQLIRDRREMRSCRTW